MRSAGAERGFVTAPGPAAIATHMNGRHYDEYEAYLFACRRGDASRGSAAIQPSGVVTLPAGLPDRGHRAATRLG